MFQAVSSPRNFRGNVNGNHGTSHYSLNQRLNTIIAKLNVHSLLKKY